MKRKNKQEEKDFSLIYHILFFAFLGFIVWLLFFMIPSKQKSENILQRTGQMYKEKINQSKPLVTEQYIPPSNENLSPFEQYKFVYQYKITTQNNPNSVTFKLPIPTDEPERQYITNTNLTPKPTKMYRSGVNTYAEYNIVKPKNGTYVITLTGNAKVRTYDLKTARMVNKNSDKEENLSRYLRSERLIETSDPYVQSVAAYIKGSTDVEYIQNVFKYLFNIMTYVPNHKDIGAKRALETRKGKCSEYAAAMVALLRLKKIPARIVAGNIARDYDTKHAWVEVYFDRFGWVTFDPTNRGVLVNKYKNKQLVGKGHVLDAYSIDINYIASSRNEFTPWNLTYTYSSDANAKVSVSSEHKISKI